MLIISDILLPEYTLNDFHRWIEFKENVGWDTTIFVSLDQLPEPLLNRVIEYFNEASHKTLARLKTISYETVLSDERYLKVIFKNNKVRIYINNAPYVSLLKSSDCKHAKS